MEYRVFQTARLDTSVPAIPRLDPASRVTESPAPFADAAFSDVWTNAQHLRTEFVRAFIRELLRYLRPTTTQASIGSISRTDRKAGGPNVS
jgi:hypothetical protein